MKIKKIPLITLLVIALIISYLFLSYANIYRRIGHTALRSPDSKYTYDIKGNVSKGKLIKFVALGDSLTAGVGTSNYQDSYPYLIAQKLAQTNAGVTLEDQAYPGARTSDLIKNLLTGAIGNNPNIITVLVGVNDIHGRVSKTDFTTNYSYILKELKEKTTAKIFAISIPYIGAKSLLLPPYNYYFKYQTVEYNKIIKSLASSAGVTYIDLYTPTEFMFNNPDLYSGDSFHPSVNGYKLWADILYDNISKQP